jgi:thiamine-phosphate pyrophosphorylase
VCRGRGLDPLAVARACLAGGARLLQLRCKEEGSAAILALADALVADAHRVGGRLIVNDRVDIARMCGADGVHVGQEDLPAEDVRRLLGPAAIVGVSTHDPAQVDRALAGPASYIAVGPIYGTATKETGYGARGLDLVRYAAGRGMPVVAIGGITLDRGADVLAAGASSLAVITDLLADDVEARVRAFMELPRHRGAP